MAYQPATAEIGKRSMNEIPYTRVEKRQRGFFGWLFLVLFLLWNAFMLLVAIGLVSEDASVLYGLFGLIIWVIGSAITGLLAIVTRGSKVIITEVHGAENYSPSLTPSSSKIGKNLLRIVAIIVAIILAVQGYRGITKHRGEPFFGQTSSDAIAINKAKSESVSTEQTPAEKCLTATQFPYARGTTYRAAITNHCLIDVTIDSVTINQKCGVTEHKVVAIGRAYDLTFDDMVPDNCGRQLLQLDVRSSIGPAQFSWTQADADSLVRD